MTKQRSLQFPQRSLTLNGLAGAVFCEKGPRGALLRALLFEPAASNVTTNTAVSYRNVAGDVDVKLTGGYEQKDGTSCATVLFTAPDSTVMNLGIRAVYPADFASDNDIGGDCSIKPGT